MTWLYKGLPYNPPEDFTTDDLYGFVYLITNRANAKKYVGKKFFWSKKTLPKTKTRKRRKITYVLEFNYIQYNNYKYIQILV